MSLTDLSQVLQHASFLSAVLAGFSVTLFVTLLTISRKHRMVSYAAGTALVAAALLGISAISGVAGMVGAILDQESALGPGSESTIYGAFRWTNISFLMGMFVFFISLGLCGWVHSRRFGVVSSVISGLTIVALCYFLVAVMQAF